MLRRFFLFLSVLAVLAVVAGPALAIQYTITDLGHLGGASYAAEAYGINASGQVTGYAADAGGHPRAFFWDSGVMTNLGIPSNAATSFGNCINDAGKVVGQGYYYIDDPYAEGDSAMISNGTGGMDYLLLNGTTPVASKANAINNQNIVVGKASFTSGTDTSTQAFYYDMDQSTLTNLGTLGGYFFSEAKDVNLDGDVVGFGYTPSFTQVQFLYSEGSMTDLSTLITGVSGTAAINDNGWIVGTGATANFASGGFLYNKTTSVDLGLLLDNPSTSPYDVNNNGLVVGQAVGDGRNGIPNRAFVYDSTTSTISDLYALLDASGQAAWSELSKATAVNDAGQIVGYGKTAGGDYRAFLLTPVPEPSTIALAALGLVGLLCYAWRKRK